jgi:hypothetical protein
MRALSSDCNIRPTDQLLTMDLSLHLKGSEIVPVLLLQHGLLASKTLE